MTKKHHIYKCNKCGNIVEVVNPAGGTLVCCGEPMQLKDEMTKEGALEKHVPVIEAVEGGVLVKVGEVPHPMEESHWINFIEVFVGNEVHRAELNPGDAPEAFFNIPLEKVTLVREYCNLHGLWKNE